MCLPEKNVCRKFVAWQRYLEWWTAYGARSGESLLTGGPLQWNRPQAQAGTMEDVEDNFFIAISNGARVAILRSGDKLRVW